MSELDTQFSPLFLKLPPERIGELKFILESYDGLGIIRTLNRKTGSVVILALRDTRASVDGLIESLSEEMSIRVVPPPEGVTEDWLVTSLAANSEEG